jgi:hypothetical protein
VPIGADVGVVVSVSGDQLRQRPRPFLAQLGFSWCWSRHAVLSRWGTRSQNPPRLIHELIEVACPGQRLIDKSILQQVVPQALVELWTKAPLQCCS